VPFKKGRLETVMVDVPSKRESAEAKASVNVAKASRQENLGGHFVVGKYQLWKKGNVGKKGLRV